MDLPEPTWGVPGLIPAGVTLLAGPPKIGKSWMGLGISVATPEAWVDQSLQTMQWVRFVAGLGRLEYLARQALSWPLKSAASELGVKSAQLVSTWRAISKP